MAEELTQQQRQAVENRGGKLLVSAAAGSGKTKVLIDRLLSYMTDPVNPANIDDFLIITYTKAAAAELRGKIAAKLSERLSQQPDNRHLQRQMQRLYLSKISTVHSFCTELLREYAYELDLSGDFRVADENECVCLREQAMAEILDEAYQQRTGDNDFRAFVDTQGLGRDDRLVPEIIQKVFDSARCHLDPDGWLEDCLRHLEVSQDTDAAQTLWGRYLLDDLHQYLDTQISAMDCCARLAGEDPGLTKVTALLENTVISLRFLRESESWDQVVQRRKIDYGTLRFPKKVADPELPDRIKSVRDSCKKGLEKRLKAFSDPSEMVMEDLLNTAGAVRGLIQLVRDFSERYQKLKKHRRCLDFGDLEHRALDLLLGKRRASPTRIAREVGSRFREVLVDEYQDSNGVQDAIFEALTRENQNCFMVGDVKQSIYQFRLADPGIFLEKYNTYKDAENAQPGEGRRILLSRNFRSGGAVLEAANDVFRLCMSRKVGGLNYTDDEALVEGIPHEPLGEPETELHVIVTQEDSYAQEAQFVAERAAELLDGKHMIRGKEGLRPIVPEDIVILLRSPGSVGRDFLNALAAKKIRCAFSGGRNLLETGEISVLRSILQIISNPRQDIPLLCVLASPVFGFTANDLASIRAGRRNMELYDALLQDGSEKTRQFLTTLEHLRRQARMVPVAKLLEEIFTTTRMDSIYAAMEDGVERSASLQAFFRIAVEFESTSRRDLEQFLEHLDAMEDSGLTIPDADVGGAVTIMSIHKSKGLEFPVVFLCGLARSFNRESLRAQILCDKELGLGMSAVDTASRVRYPTVAKRAIVAKATAESLSEELRVLYVAMTRARDRLIMTYAAKTPEKELQKFARQMDICDIRQMTAEVTCPGEWVLMQALSRTEAGALFGLAECKPAQTHMGDYPWMIRTHEGKCADLSSAEEEKQVSTLPEGALEQMQAGLAFRYAHVAATQTPSKQTATQLKGRAKDEEAAEQTKPAPTMRTWRKPDFSDRKTHGGREYGTAMHALMQYIRFEACGTLDGIEAQIQELVSSGLLEAEEARYIDRQAIADFFATDLGTRLRTGENVLREFKFSILDDAGAYGENLAGEQVLLQGVVDCALIEPDGITVMDFKTDRVNDRTLSRTVERYRSQVQAYANALERIYQLPVKKKVLYFFHLRQIVEM